MDRRPEKLEILIIIGGKYTYSSNMGRISKFTLLILGQSIVVIGASYVLPAEYCGILQWHGRWAWAIGMGAMGMLYSAMQGWGRWMPETWPSLMPLPQEGRPMNRKWSADDWRTHVINLLSDDSLSSNLQRCNPITLDLVTLPGHPQWREASRRVISSFMSRHIHPGFPVKRWWESLQNCIWNENQDEYMPGSFQPPLL